MEPTPSTSRLVSVNGLKLQLRDYGTQGRPPILCLHGGAANGHWFDFVAQGFTADHHVIALDLRGHGDSEWARDGIYHYQHHVDDVAAIAEQLDLRDFVLLGHSMGGMVSLVYAASRPQRLGRLVILDTTLCVTASRTGKHREIAARTGRSFASQDDLAANFKLAAEGTLAPRSVVEYVGRHSGREQPDGTWRLKFDRATYGNREPIDGLALLPRVTVPTLIARAVHSQRVPPETDAVAEASGGLIRMDVVPESYHHVTLDNPDGVIRVVRRFLDATRTGC